MLLWVFLMVSIVTVQSNLEAMIGGGGVGAEEAKGAVAGKYTYELCNVHTASIGDIARIMELAAQKNTTDESKKVTGEEKSAKKDKSSRTAGAGDEEEIEDEEKEVAFAGGFFDKRIDIRDEYTLLHCGILVARYGKDIVGYLVCADKKLSEQCGAAPKDASRDRNYCTIGEICIDKAHLENGLDRLLGEIFIKTFAPQVIPTLDLVRADLVQATHEESSALFGALKFKTVKRVRGADDDAEDSGTTRGGFSWKSAVAHEYMRTHPTTSSGGSSSRGARNGCCLFDCP